MKEKTNHAAEIIHSSAELLRMSLVPVALLLSIALQLWPICAALLVLYYKTKN